MHPTTVAQGRDRFRPENNRKYWERLRASQRFSGTIIYCDSESLALTKSVADSSMAECLDETNRQTPSEGTKLASRLDSLTTTTFLTHRWRSLSRGRPFRPSAAMSPLRMICEIQLTFVSLLV